MKVHILPQEGGTNTVFIQRTLPAEGPGRSVADVKDSELESTIERLVKEMRGEDQEELP